MNKVLVKYIRYVLYFSPAFIQNYVNEKKSKREIQMWMDRAKRTKVSKEEISDIIQSLDIGGVDVMLHSSMANIGKMSGGCKWVSECLLNKVDIKNHTLLVSALPYRGQFKSYLEKNPTFDVSSAPIAMGAINEYIGSMQGAKRSIHPTHSVVAIGKDAVTYTNEHHLDETPFGIHSPYFKLIKNKGKVILFGATLNNLTFIHAIEDILGDCNPDNVYYKKRFSINCYDINGNNVIVNTSCHDPLHSIRRDASMFYDELVASGLMTVTKIGESEVCVLDAFGFTLFYLQKILDGRSIYGKVKLNKEFRERIVKIKESMIIDK